MNAEYLNQLIDVAKEKNDIDKNNDWYDGSKTYFQDIKLELDEVAQEIKLGKRCYLEDELGDVLWDYLNLLLCLEDEGKISLEKVFERSFVKYRERIDGINQGKYWSEIKKVQKVRLAQEQEERTKLELNPSG